MNLKSEELLIEIYSSFEPFQPPSKEAYVDCQEVRGKWDVIRELGRKITRSRKPTCQLYTGHRGVGKSTELSRLKEYLEKNKYFVVYFAADELDIEPQDTDYAEILFACTRHLVEEIKLINHNPLLQWLEQRWVSLRDLALTEVEFEGLSLEAQVSQFAKIMANLKAVPDKRRELRKRINNHTPSLINALNDFIIQAREVLPPEKNQGLVIIVDNLDRIVETKEEGKPSNYDEIYLNRSEMLKGLECHVIYTVPITMVYSGRATRLEDNYDTPDVLPMVMVRNFDNSANQQGLNKLKELISRRIQIIDSRLTQTLVGSVEGLEIPPVFDNSETLDKLCLMSGGHVRNLMQLIQKAIDWTEELPITAQAVNRAVEEARQTYRRQIQEDQWDLLANVYHHRQIKRDEAHLRLLLNRCLLEYRYYDENEALQTWCNVHPLVEGIRQFQEALSRIN